MDYETKRLRIVMWTVVALLILSIVGASLLFILKMHPSTPTPNQVNVGERISRASFKSTLTNADVWDRTSTTDWTGNGTSTSPYLITRASQLAGLSTKVNAGTTYAGKYFKLDINLDMHGDTLTFTPIGSSASKSFQGNFDGDGHTISNLHISETSSYGGLFGHVRTNNSSVKISNINIEVLFKQTSYTCEYFGTLVAYSVGTSQNNVIIDNCKVTTASASTTFLFSGNKDEYTGVAGGLVGSARYTSFNDCSVSSMNTIVQQSSFAKDIGGLVGILLNGKVTGCQASMDVTGVCPFNGIGIVGLISSATNSTINNCYIVLNYSTSGDMGSPTYYGVIGTSDNSSIYNCLIQGTINAPKEPVIVCAISGGTLNECKNVIFNADLNIAKIKPRFSMVYTSSSSHQFLYNSTKINSTNANVSSNTGATTDVNMKLSSTYSNWADFDTYWVINENINSGYPMLKKFIEVAKVTGFEGSGTENSPYLVKTHQELLSVANYYNNNNNIENDVYWKLANDIVVSKDANNAFIHFTPICYAKEFDGYFDGNGKTISGLLIDNQYEYTGLFGTIGANHWVKNLTVKGNIYWDQAYAVGGVAGRVMNGGYLQNCKFDGNIIGVLNTKQSTETNGVIGKYGINGAIDCTATYTDLKYAKIGGTTDAPTYTYYLYDWARITTSLYNKKVG